MIKVVRLILWWQRRLLQNSSAGQTFRTGMLPNNRRCPFVLSRKSWNGLDNIPTICKRHQTGMRSKMSLLNSVLESSRLCCSTIRIVSWWTVKPRTTSANYTYKNTSLSSPSLSLKRMFGRRKLQNLQRNSWLGDLRLRENERLLHHLWNYNWWNV